MFGIAITPQLLKIAGVIGLVIALIGCFEWAQSSAERRGYTQAQTEYTKRALQASEAARKRENELHNKLQEAENEFKQREVALNAAADSARAERDGLRDELAAIGDRLSRASADALRQYARTANSVLSECIDRYSKLAQKADGHAADALMLSRSWPR